MGMSRPSYGRGQGSFFGRRPPPMRNPRMPMPPMNQPQTPSGGGFLAQLGSSPMMQRPMPGGPGKGRPRGRFMRGGPGKGRGQGMPQSMFGMQQPAPARPSFGQLMTQGPMNMPRPTPRPVPFMGQTGQVGNNPPAPPPQLGNNPPQMQPMPARPSFGQLMAQGPMNMPRPPPRPVPFMGQTGQIGQVGNNMPQPSFMGRVGQAFTQGPTSMDTPLSQMRTHALPTPPLNAMGFYGGGITDLY